MNSPRKGNIRRTWEHSSQTVVLSSLRIFKIEREQILYMKHVLPIFLSPMSPFGSEEEDSAKMFRLQEDKRKFSGGVVQFNINHLLVLFKEILTMTATRSLRDLRYCCSPLI